MISPSFLVGKCGWRFWQAFGRGDWDIFARRDFFLHVMVGGDGGVVRPKKLVGLVGTVTDSRLTLLQHHASSRSKHSFLPQCRNTRNLKWVCEGRPQLLLCKFQKLRPPTQMNLAVQYQPGSKKIVADRGRHVESRSSNKPQRGNLLTYSDLFMVSPTYQLI